MFGCFTQFWGLNARPFVCPGTLEAPQPTADLSTYRQKSYTCPVTMFRGVMVGNPNTYLKYILFSWLGGTARGTFWSRCILLRSWVFFASLCSFTGWVSHPRRRVTSTQALSCFLWDRGCSRSRLRLSSFLLYCITYWCYNITSNTYNFVIWPCLGWSLEPGLSFVFVVLYGSFLTCAWL